MNDFARRDHAASRDDSDICALLLNIIHRCLTEEDEAFLHAVEAINHSERHESKRVEDIKEIVLFSFII